MRAKKKKGGGKRNTKRCEKQFESQILQSQALYLIYVDLLLILFLFLQEVLVLLLDDKLGQRVLRQRRRLGSVQGSVFW